MRALSLRGPRQAMLIDAPVPRPGPDQVLVRISACGVCGSDLNAWRGVAGIEYPLPPGAPGHEIIGTIAAVGPGVDPSRVGDVVTGLLWNGFAEFGLTAADHLVTLPRGLDEILGEPLACAANVARRAAVRADDEVAFVGFGYLAALVAQCLPSPPGRWIAIARRPSSRGLARHLGAALAYDFSEIPNDAWDHFGVVIETTGAQQPLDYATWLTAYGGRLVIAGYHADGPRTVDMQSWNWKGIDVINAHERQPSTYIEALRSRLDPLVRGDIRVAGLHTHSWPLGEVAAAFEAADAHRDGFVKALVRP